MCGGVSARRTAERVGPQARAAVQGLRCLSVLLSGILARGKDWASISAPHLPHIRGFSGATQTPSWARPHAVTATSGPRVKSGFPGPHPHSSLPLIKPESLLGPQDRAKVLGSTSLSGGRKIEREEGSWGHGSISGLNCPYNGLGAASQRGGAEDRLVLRLMRNKLTFWVLEA